MKKTALTAIILGGGLACAAGFAHAQSDVQQSRNRHPLLRHFLQNHPQMRQHLIERFDANHDGKLDQQEKSAAREAIHQKAVERFDTNHDGTLNEAERADAKATIRQHIRGRLIERFDANHDGTIDDSERATVKQQIHARLLQRFDANHNGTLDKNELPARLQERLNRLESSAPSSQ